jgi:hypothetical protein
MSGDRYFAVRKVISDAKGVSAVLKKEILAMAIRGPCRKKENHGNPQQTTQASH